MTDISTILTRAPFTPSQRHYRWRALVARARRGSRVSTPSIRLSGTTLIENSAVDTMIGTLSVSGATGTPTFTLVNSASSKTKLTGSNILAGSSAANYEVTPSFDIIVSVSGVTPTIANTTFTINVTDVDEIAPTITSSNAVSVSENVAFSHTMTANELVTWTKTGGADAALFSLSGPTLTMAAKDFEAPADANVDNVYQVQITGTDLAGNATNQTVSVTVTNVVDETAPTITSSASISQAENAILNHALTANETVTWTKVGGADAALFTLVGSTLTLAAQDFEAPADSGSNNTYVVTVRATDTVSLTADQTITVTITDVGEGGGGATAPSAVDLDAGSDTGVSSTDNITTDTTPDFNVTGDLDVGDIIKTYVDGVLYGTPYTVQVGEDGSGSTLPLSLPALPDDTYAIGFTITRGGGETALSPTETVTIYAQTQRRSAVHLGMPWRGILPVPDANMKYPDRYTVGQLYAR